MSHINNDCIVELLHLVGIIRPSTIRRYMIRADREISLRTIQCKVAEIEETGRIAPSRVHQRGREPVLNTKQRQNVLLLLQQNPMLNSVEITQHLKFSVPLPINSRLQLEANV